MSDTKALTRFDYLLNAFEQASQSARPAEHGYAAKRRALYDYVRALEAAMVERDSLLAMCRLVMSIPGLTDEQLAELQANCRAVAARSVQGSAD